MEVTVHQCGASQARIDLLYKVEHLELGPLVGRFHTDDVSVCGTHQTHDQLINLLFFQLVVVLVDVGCRRRCRRVACLCRWRLRRSGQILGLGARMGQPWRVDERHVQKAFVLDVHVDGYGGELGQAARELLTQRSMVTVGHHPIMIQVW